MGDRLQNYLGKEIKGGYITCTGKVLRGRIIEFLVVAFVLGFMIAVASGISADGSTVSKMSICLVIVMSVLCFYWFFPFVFGLKAWISIGTDGRAEIHAAIKERELRVPTATTKEGKFKWMNKTVVGTRDLLGYVDGGQLWLGTRHRVCQCIQDMMQTYGFWE